MRNRLPKVPWDDQAPKVQSRNASPCVGKCTVAHEGRGFLGPDYFPDRALKKNRRFAGRSAMRRMRYGYQSVPYGTYARTR